ncbi:MAG: hypothetical protein JXR63_13275 [Spirochaetales bacterium]|nr:hypothetical protein [Spirochaetales bacterium]
MNTDNLSFCPGHITGFFRVENKHSEILKRGSTGAGFSIARGVTTKSELAPKTQIFINGKEKTKKAKVSNIAIDLFNKKAEVNCNYKIEHNIDLPRGCGFGTSAAGVISLLKSLNNLHYSKLDEVALLQIAHQAEILAKTGLGTVAGLSVDGFEIRVKPGAPGVSEVKSFKQSTNLVAVFLVNGPVKTTKMLKDKSIVRKINNFSQKAKQELLEDFSYLLFMEKANNFSKMTAIGNKKITKMLEYSHSLGVDAAMLMFGNGIFTIIESELAQDYIQKFKSNFHIKESFTSEIYYSREEI